MFLSSFYLFLNSKTSVIINLKPLRLDAKFISLFLIADSVPSSCSKGLKQSKFHYYKNLRNL